MLRQEMSIGYFDKIHRPGEKRGVMDNHTDYEACENRVHCNATTYVNLAPQIVWDEETQQCVLKNDEAVLQEKLRRFHDVIQGKRHSLLVGGGDNNVYYPGSYMGYIRHIPEAHMQDVDGRVIELRDPGVRQGEPIPMPGVDDPTILKLYAAQLQQQAAQVPGCHYVAGYQLGGEVLWPEFFWLGNGDYRPTAWKHFAAWCRLQGEEVPSKEETLAQGSKARNLWLRFREQAMADRGGYYFRAILEKDDTHLVYFPTHGSVMHGDNRFRTGLMPDTLAAVVDGIEMGHIMVDDDAERRNVLLTALNASYGVPVIIPRLGDKMVDFGMVGGGVGFPGKMMRRLLYENLGMGIHFICPLHWQSKQIDGEFNIKYTPLEDELRTVFDEFVVAAPYMMGMGRMQPQVGVLASDEIWLQWYDMRWTALLQDMLEENAYGTLITDALIQPGLSRRMPLLVLLANHLVGEATLKRLLDYLNEGGKVIVWGDFALGSPLREQVLNHSRCFVSQAPAEAKQRMLREHFVGDAQAGTWTHRYPVHAVDYAAFKAEMSSFASEVVFHPFVLNGNVEKVNVYPLTDRAAVGCVVVNRGSEDAVFTVAPDERLLKNARAIDMLTGKEISMPLSLPAYGTALIFFGEEVPDDFEAFEEVICAAEDAFDRWKALGADVGPLRHNNANMKTGSHYIKRYALAKALLSSLALRTRVEKDNEDLLVRVDCFDAAGNTVENVHILLRMVPGSMKQYVFTWDGEKHVCRVKKEDIAKVYNPDTCDYEPLSGAARFVIQAEKDDKQGGCLVNIKI